MKEREVHKAKAHQCVINLISEMSFDVSQRHWTWKTISTLFFCSFSPPFHFHSFIVSPFNDELIEIRSAPLPHDLQSNQIEMKRGIFCILKIFFLLPCVHSSSLRLFLLFSRKILCKHEIKLSESIESEFNCQVCEARKKIDVRKLEPGSSLEALKSDYDVGKKLTK